MLASFMPIPENKKADLKLIMLYHDLGKTILPSENLYSIKKLFYNEAITITFL